MKLIVKNFGPIEDACIDVKPLTVFVGPGNRGKSYLATLLHTIMQSPRFYVVKFDDNFEGFMFTKDFEVAAKKILRFIMNAYDQPSDDEINSTTDHLLKAYCEIFNTVWRSKMDYYFGEISEELLKKKTLIQIISDDEKNVMDLTTPKRSSFHKDLINTVTQNLQKYVKSSKIHEEHYGRFLHYLLFTTEDAIHETIDFGYDIGKHARYMPDVRGSIIRSYRLMVDRLIKRATFGGMKAQLPGSPFNGANADFLSHVTGIDERALHFSQSKKRQSITQLADDVETQLLDEGKVKVTLSPTGMPNFSYAFTQENKKHDIPLMHTSSTVSELSPFVLFLRYFLEKGDFLIFEEPEAHLHPEAQRRITALLVHLMQQGVNVLITTHSSIILEQLGNCVFAQRLIKKYAKKNPDKIEQIRKKHPISLSAPLKETDTAAYDFVRPPKNGRGTIVKHIPYDLGTDYLPENHYDISNELIEEGETLQTIYDDESIDP